jgi:hypothetical protein
MLNSFPICLLYLCPDCIYFFSLTVVQYEQPSQRVLGFHQLCFNILTSAMSCLLPSRDLQVKRSYRWAQDKSTESVVLPKTKSRCK